MKALVIGGGSIGRRHLANLGTLGVEHRALVEPMAERRGPDGFATLEEGLAWKPDVALVTSPSHLHVEQALACARAGAHLFVEKPLSHSWEGVPELVREVESRSLISMVGCNMRFHPGPARLRALLDAGELGRLIFGRLHCGSYLPEWRPGQDYRQTYSASAESGGCILDAIHEIDLAWWLLGPVTSLVAAAGHLSSLEIQAEDVAALLLSHASGCMSEVHLDYVQPTYERGCQLVGEAGAARWDFSQPEVRLFRRSTREWESISWGDWEINDMYLDEFRTFLECVRAGRPTFCSVREAASVLRVALGAREAAASGRRIELEVVSV